MRTFDFAPFYRSTVGFDRVFSTLDQLVGVDGSVPSYPPYNIARTDENAYRISVAVAGFTDGDLSIEAKENTLTIHGEKQTNDEEETGDVLYQGIAARCGINDHMSNLCAHRYKRPDRTTSISGPLTWRARMQRPWKNSSVPDEI